MTDALLIAACALLWCFAFRPLIRAQLASVIVIVLGIAVRTTTMPWEHLLFESITLCILALLLHFWQRPPMQLALYALNPLVILYLGDSAMLICFIAATLLAFRVRARWFGYPLLCLAVVLLGNKADNLPVWQLCILLYALFWLWMLQQDSRPRNYALAWMWLVACFPFNYSFIICLPFFLALAPSRGWFVLVLAAFLSPPVAIPIAIFAALLFLRDFLRIDQPWQPRYRPIRSLDIVVPVYNESANLAKSLDALQAAIDYHRNHDSDPWDIHVHLVDGGSTDDTSSIAERYPFAMSASPERGRGQQIAHGVNAGQSDLILMLHADAVIIPEGLQKLADEFRAQPTLSWGILGHRYPDMRRKMQFIELSNRFRFHACAMAFGDQGIFVRRDVLADVGGIPEIPLMEDVELSLRLASHPTRRSLGYTLEVSTRRWEKRRFTGYTFQVLRLVSSYLLQRRFGRPVETIAARMYRIYYGSG